MNKGERTRHTILESAMALASERGFEALSIGTLAERVGMSKSGLFAHFGSREELQVAAIEAAASRFSELVFQPALKAARGLPRLEALLDNWLSWVDRSGLQGACPMQAAAHEFDDRPGPVRDAVVAHYRRLEQELGRAVSLAVAQGHLRAELPVDQFVFRLLGVVLACYHRRHLMGREDAGTDARTAFAALVDAVR